MSHSTVEIKSMIKNSDRIITNADGTVTIYTGDNTEIVSGDDWDKYIFSTTIVNTDDDLEDEFNSLGDDDDLEDEFSSLGDDDLSIP